MTRQNWVERWSATWSDDCNPVLVKEMRQVFRSRSYWGCLAGIVVAELLAFYAYFVHRELWTADFDSGQPLLATYLILWEILLLVPSVTVAERWGMERRQDGITPEKTTPLAPGVIVRGKFMAQCLTGLTALAAGMPVLALFERAWIFQPASLVVLALPLFVAALALLAATGPQNGKRNGGGMATGAAVLFSIFLMPYLLMTAFAFGWPGVVLELYGLLGGLGMMLMLAAGIIGAPRANRFWKVRMLFYGWLLLGIPILYAALVQLGDCAAETFYNAVAIVLLLAGSVAMLCAACAPFGRTRRDVLDEPVHSLVRAAYRFGAFRVLPAWFYGAVLQIAGAALIIALHHEHLLTVNMETGWGGTDAAGMASTPWPSLLCVGMYAVFYANVVLLLRRISIKTRPVIVLIWVLVIAAMSLLVALIHLDLRVTVLTPVFGLYNPQVTLPTVGGLVIASLLALIVAELRSRKEIDHGLQR